MNTSVDRYDIVASSAYSDPGTYVLKSEDCFAVLSEYGDINPLSNGEQGLYCGGTRFLSRYVLSPGRERLILLSSSVRDNNLVLAVDLALPEVLRPDGSVVVPHGSVHVHREKLLHDSACFEHLAVTNYGSAPADLELGFSFRADHADIFEVRGMRRPARGAEQPPRVTASEVQLNYVGLDGAHRTTRITFQPQPAALEASYALFSLHLEPHETQHLYVTAGCGTCAGGTAAARLPSYEEAYRAACERAQRFTREDCHIQSSSSFFNEWMERSLADVHLMITDTPWGPYPYAGIPWFSTAFGRDGILTALEALWVNPALARGVLRYLAHHQAEALDSARDAEPGKILHETRAGEMAALGEVPFGRYYGSVDSTPLFVLLLGEYLRTTHDEALAQHLLPNALRAIDWIDHFGDPDGDGFVEYAKRSPDGLVQQGWKDSHDSVFHADGSAAEPPIALVEVQGYVFAAKLAAATLCERFGELARAAELREKAERLRERFEREFWCDDLGTYALALDGRKKPCRVRSSNAGHAAFTGIAREDRVRTVADQLLSPEMFSGWGVRTLATTERRYNPMSYHNGSVWPHDNAIIAAGLARYGHKQHALRILQGLFDASQFFDLHRMPELFCGFPRREGDGPTQYPVACAPQAWAAASPFLLLASVLGLELDGATRSVVLNAPVLPDEVHTLCLANLHAGEGRVDLVLHRYSDDVGVNVTRRQGGARVISMR
jgi:glycogen debranching enzyme